jgi:hypothetical protein
MTELILDFTVGVVVGRVTSWPRNLPVGEGRGLPGTIPNRVIRIVGASCAALGPRAAPSPGPTGQRCA